MKYVYAIILLAVLVSVFIVSFMLYVKTPEPKGCEIKPSEEKCKNCEIQGCHANIYAKRNSKEEDK